MGDTNHSARLGPAFPEPELIRREDKDFLLPGEGIYLEPMKFSSACLARLVAFAALFTSAADLSSLVPQGISRKAESSPAFSIDDSAYVLSPGDVVRLQWWGVGSGDHSLVVDTRGDLLVPEIGIVHTRSKRFREVRKELEEMLAQRLRPRLVSVRIVDVQPATVWIRGEVPSPGPYTIEPGSRLSVALIASGISVPELMKAGLTSYPARANELSGIPSMRQAIVVRGADTLRFDLTRAFRTGDARHDPSLYAGDVVMIPPIGPICAIRGPRSVPSVMEVIPGEQVGNFLRAAGAHPLPATVKVLSRSGVESELDTATAMPSDAGLITLAALQQNTPPRIVFVNGAVRHPGAYPFEEGLTPQDLVTKAGGAINGSDSLVVFAVHRLGSAILPGRKPGGEMLATVMEVGKSQLGYQGFTRGQYSNGKVALQPLDSVVVKKQEAVVWVGGHVANPGFVRWKHGSGWRDYVEDAGGFTGRSWRGQVRLIDPISEQDAPLDGEIRPGAAILVPEKRFIPPEQWLAIGINVVSLLTGLATVYLLVESNK